MFVLPLWLPVRPQSGLQSPVDIDPTPSPTDSEPEPSAIRLLSCSPRLWREVRDFKPDVIHCSSPGVMGIAAWLYAVFLRAPLVLSYHTHIPAYMPRYGISMLIPAMWAVLRLFHSQAFLTLCTSEVMRQELAANNGEAPVASGAAGAWAQGLPSSSWPHTPPTLLDPSFDHYAELEQRAPISPLLPSAEHRHFPHPTASACVAASSPLLRPPLHADVVHAVSGDRPMVVWKRGVDADIFHPRFKSAEMKARMTQGHPEDPLLVYVGRLGAEKNLQVRFPQSGRT